MHVVNAGRRTRPTIYTQASAEDGSIEERHGEAIASVGSVSHMAASKIILLTLWTPRPTIPLCFQIGQPAVMQGHPARFTLMTTQAPKPKGHDGTGIHPARQ